MSTGLVMTKIMLGIFGQSFAYPIAVGAGWSVIRSEMALVNYDVERVRFISDGSAALKENAPPTDPARYWWDFDLNKPGPMLSDAVRRINEAPVKPTILLWIQGEADAVRAGEENTKRYKAATRHIIGALQTAVNPTAPGTVPVFMHVVGRCSAEGCGPALQEIREAQLDLIETTGVRFLADVYDLEIKHEDVLGRFSGNRHLTPRAEAEFGFRAAQSLLSYLGEPNISPPEIVRAKREGNHVVLDIRQFPSVRLKRPRFLASIAVRSGQRLLCEGQGCVIWWSNRSNSFRIPVGARGAIEVLSPFRSPNTLDRDGLISDSAGNVLRSFVARVQ